MREYQFLALAGIAVVGLMVNESINYIHHRRVKQKMQSQTNLSRQAEGLRVDTNEKFNKAYDVLDGIAT